MGAPPILGLGMPTAKGALVGVGIAPTLSGSGGGSPLLIETFEGPNSIVDDGLQVTITNFIAEQASQYAQFWYTQKDTGVAQQGSQSCKLFAENNNNGAVLIDLGGSGNVPNEFWTSWYLRLTSDYYFGTNHKFFLVEITDSGGDHFTNYQINKGSSGLQACMRIYSETIGILYGTNCFTFETLTWYQFMTHYKINTIGQSNGVIETWIRKAADGWTQWHNFQNIQILGQSNSIVYLRYGGPRSGHEVQPTPDPQVGQMWIDHIRLGDARSDVDPL